MNERPVYLLAGGRSARRRTPDPSVQAVFRETGTAAPTIAYVGVANGDDAGFFANMADLLMQEGARQVNHAKISAKRADLKKARDILSSADAVYVSGGDVEAGMEVLTEKDMVDFLSRLHREGALFFGLSAGSIMLAREWVRWRDPDDDATAELFPCLGFAPIICDTHDEQDGWQELQAALRLSRDNTTGYGIVSGSAIRVSPDGQIEALGGVIHRYVHHGKRAERVTDLLPA